ncbi:hypothetical protein Pogu_2081 [Pyrobaculum oguniense TE7]|uniref:Uncharacterized protein n=1 Tax=Pyrobaculum oguniense (strain DSM 13380 / JCM 10595 / TE7) TaxID=698757 RepID=H6QCR2_PYROT|nr:hypothetical protein Pogu_2081 [Pyrobaculum oguniense TE7]
MCRDQQIDSGRLECSKPSFRQCDKGGKPPPRTYGQALGLTSIMERDFRLAGRNNLAKVLYALKLQAQALIYAESGFSAGRAGTVV